MKEYTKLRRLYAWIGFAFIIIASGYVLALAIELAKHLLLNL